MFETIGGIMRKPFSMSNNFYEPTSLNRINLHGKNSWIKANIEVKGKFFEVNIHDLDENTLCLDTTYNQNLDKLFTVGENISMNIHLGNSKNFFTVFWHVAKFEPYPTPTNLNLFRVRGKWDKSHTSYYSLSNLVKFLRSSNEFIQTSKSFSKKTKAA